MIRVSLAMTLLILMVSSGCVRRTLTIQTEPQGAVVFLNDEEIGSSPVTVDFTWYGDYGVICRKDGYKTLNTNVKVNAPWYQWPVFDFFADVLWPGTIHDQREASFLLAEYTAPEPEEVLERANQMRDDALFKGGE